MAERLMENILQTDVAVIGAGPAGMMAAISAAQEGHNVTIFERMNKLGAKILATGGGRCNISNLDTQEQFISKFSTTCGRFITPALHEFPVESLIEFFSYNGLSLYSPDSQRLYPKSEKAQDVVRCMVRICNRLNISINTGCEVSELRVVDKNIHSIVCFDSEIPCGKVIMTTGGQSYPELGSNGSGYKLLRDTGHKIILPVAALTGLIFQEKWMSELAGVAISGELSFKPESGKKRISESGDVLFTHKGLSGPATLNISRHLSRELALGSKPEVTLKINPEQDWKSEVAKWRRNNAKSQILSLLSQSLPKRLCSIILKLCEISPEQQISELKAANQDMLIQTLSGMELQLKSTCGFKDSMVTSGGVCLKEVKRQSMQSRLIDNLYFAGEILDVDGPCGGYNLQWAFSSGFLAGKLKT